MNADDVISIIEAIPQYIKYFYPGYVTIYVYAFLRAQHISDTQVVILKSLALSYVYLVVVNRLNLTSEIKSNGVLILIAVLVALLMYWITKCKRIKKLFSYFGIETTFYNNEIEAIQSKNGTWLIVYLKDEDVVYEGWLHLKELEPGARNYISLTNFRKYKLDANGKPQHPYIDEHDNESEEEVIIFFEEIKRIEKRKT